MKKVKVTLVKEHAASFKLAMQYMLTNTHGINIISENDETGEYIMKFENEDAMNLIYQLHFAQLFDLDNLS